MVWKYVHIIYCTHVHVYMRLSRWQIFVYLCMIKINFYVKKIDHLLHDAAEIIFELVLLF